MTAEANSRRMDVEFPRRSGGKLEKKKMTHTCVE
jgi:hypothetical protein